MGKFGLCRVRFLLPFCLEWMLGTHKWRGLSVPIQVKSLRWRAARREEGDLVDPYSPSYVPFDVHLLSVSTHQYLIPHNTRLTPQL